LWSILSIIGASTLDLGKRLVVVERHTSGSLDILQVFNGHLIDRDGDLDTILFVEVDFSIFQANELCLYSERARSVCPGANFQSVWLCLWLDFVSSASLNVSTH
jgi:hypothetical protein